MKSDEELRQSEARLSRAELASSSGNWELHLDTQTIFTSAGAINIYGLNAKQYHFSDIKMAALPEYRALLDAAMNDLIQQDKPYDVEFRIHAMDSGELKDIHSVAFYEKENRIVFGVIQDVTERRRIRKALEQEELRRRIFWNKPVMGSPCCVRMAVWLSGILHLLKCWVIQKKKWGGLMLKTGTLNCILKKLMRSPVS